MIDYKYQILSRLFNSIVLRNKIFQHVYEIHRALSKRQRVLIMDWNDLACFPEILLQLNMIDRFNRILDVLVRDYRFTDQNSKREDTGYFKDFFSQCINVAARLGDMESLMFLHYNRTEGCSTRALDAACANGYMHIVLWLHNHRTEGCSTDAIDQAAGNGHLEIVQFLLANRTEGFTEKAISNSSRRGFLEIVKLLHATGKANVTTDAMDRAALDGHLDVIRFLNENRSEGCTVEAINNAASGGFLECVKFLHENRSEGCNRYAVHFAAINGFLDVVRYLLENRTEGGCYDTLERASLNSNPEVFQYLYLNTPNRGDCENVMDLFARCKDTAGLEWCKNNTTLKCSKFAYRVAVEHESLEGLKWVQANTTHALTSTDNLLDKAASLNNLEIVKYLHDAGLSCSTEAMDQAKDLSILEFLHHNTTQGCTTRALGRAIEDQDLPRIKFLMKNRTEGYSDNLYGSPQFYYIKRLEIIKEKNLI
ncbi:hypothetical protein PPL_11163 [Heterostelium album PN500]|uniref:Ankyrin repeat protein n=1 Tax=Heterostelium pallidum (strain ATCC 26659 / Pp 5 / PN500) TaxID=670386 RepID=D3BTQ3_HETP5|nr:hypothetical protein PPL_11163 [Heterostelium album PN500]EFA75089.1 hypothetical protein PPL_11163 [Heterostelium album PN500]|eukprot:XP_020427223.1 hypothetical protein PPL_11163 [Heterostelium album PN500]